MRTTREQRLRVVVFLDGATAEESTAVAAIEGDQDVLGVAVIEDPIEGVEVQPVGALGVVLARSPLRGALSLIVSLDTNRHLPYVLTNLRN